MTEFNWHALESGKPFFGCIYIRRFGRGAKVKPFKPGNRLKYYFAIKVGTDLEWNVKFTRLIRLTMRPEWNSWLGSRQGSTLLCPVLGFWAWGYSVVGLLGTLA